MSILHSLRPMPDLKVLVSAGASGIGARIARAFAEAGSRVHVCDINRSAINRLASESPGITASMADVSVPSDVDRMFDDVRTTLGGLDVLVNNASIAGPTGPIEEIEPTEWDRTIAVNLSSQYYFARRAVPLLKHSHAHPILIAMGSVAGRRGYPLRTAYVASKWAVVGLMKSLAIELGPYGVRVNAILSGPIAGERTQGVIASRAANLGISFDEIQAHHLDRISLRRMVNRDDVAAMALFLCSPAARNMSGQAISVDGNVEYL